MSKGLKIKECVNEVRGSKNVTVRLLMDCDVKVKKQQRVELQLEGTHSLFWTQVYLPSVWVSLTFLSS